ncbi:hypothetical protein MOKP45_42870 [Mycobacterium avium subsp. hominissuis]
MVAALVAVVELDAGWASDCNALVVLVEVELAVAVLTAALWAACPDGLVTCGAF